MESVEREKINTRLQIEQIATKSSGGQSQNVEEGKKKKRGGFSVIGSQSAEAAPAAA